MAKNNEKNLRKTNPFPSMEEEALNFWDKNKIFEKSVEREAPQGPQSQGRGRDYVFYDGPPFATGTPHYGHIVASVMKDVVPRYWTMKGYRIERKWGWDCHGLPIENIVEKELGFKSKKDIEKLGIEKFNETCRSKVLGYVDEWKKTINRLGRWADMENAYQTMDKDYMESIWWVFKQIYDKGLVYEGYRSMHICPRCETTLSQMEVAEGYKVVKDLSAITKFKITDENFLKKYCDNKDTSFIAWTTTPWSIPTTMGLAVGEKFTYVVLRYSEGQIIFVKDRLDYITKFLGEEKYEIIKELKGSDMAGISYDHPFGNIYKKHPEVKDNDKAYKTYTTDYVSTEDGTGIVTINGAFGEIDMEAAQKIGLPIVKNVKTDGTFTEEMGKLAGVNVKPIDDTQKTDIEIIKHLAKNDALFAKEKYEHSYPHCWRCDTPLLNYATSSWFVKITDVKDKALKLAKEINWTPSHIKEGRFGQWLEGARDWSISRQRFWASVIPIWKCAGQKSEIRNQKSEINKCNNLKVIGSVSELEKLSGQKVDDLHKHIIDKITFTCDECGGTMKRIPDVLDTWFDSGSMPYAQMHYPFDNEKKFEKNFPAEFIAEGVDQTRAWFYYLHVIATAIKQKPAFKNVIVNGIVLAEDGKKMSKRLQNYPDPNEVMQNYGADALRYYLTTSPVMQAENLNFAEIGVQEAMRKINMLLWNVYKFYEMYADNAVETRYIASLPKDSNVLDKWIIARLNELIKEVTENMDSYNIVKAARPIEDFISDLSTWYIRRSRDRFKSENEKDKKAALATTKYVLEELAKVIAPFTPFIAETIWQKVTGNDFKDGEKSVHLELWPSTHNAQRITHNVIEDMEMVRKIVEMGLAKRDEAGIRVRQPLAELRIKNYELRNDYETIIKNELNIKKVSVETRYGASKEGELSIEISLELTPELIQEGIKRELVRAINNARKDAGLTIRDRAVVYYQTNSKDIKQAFEKFSEDIKKDTLADDLQVGGDGDITKINQETVQLKIERITRNA